MKNIKTTTTITTIAAAEKRTITTAIVYTLNITCKPNREEMRWKWKTLTPASTSFTAMTTAVAVAALADEAEILPTVAVVFRTYEHLLGNTWAKPVKNEKKKKKLKTYKIIHNERSEIKVKFKIAKKKKKERNLVNEKTFLTWFKMSVCCKIRHKK